MSELAYVIRHLPHSAEVCGGKPLGAAIFRSSLLLVAEFLESDQVCPVPQMEIRERAHAMAPHEWVLRCIFRLASPQLSQTVAAFSGSERTGARVGNTCLGPF